MSKSITYVIANFGGPRDEEEISPFLVELLTDIDVIQTKLPKWIQTLLFRRVAKKRAKRIVADYEMIGGKSPIFEDTEELAAKLRKRLPGSLMTFHRYLPSTHSKFIQTISQSPCDEIRIFPMFPQFTYATTGSIARWFDNNLPKNIVSKMRWIKSYANHPYFISVHQKMIRTFLRQNNLAEEECIFLFSAHGVPKTFIAKGDVYQEECEASYRMVMRGFPRALGRISYQSQFGKEEWLRPYTSDICADISTWCQDRKHVLFIPITFTSDHIETLFEIETMYMPPVKEQGLIPHRVPALTLNEEWIETIVQILHDQLYCNNQMLIRKD